MSGNRFVNTIRNGSSRFVSSLFAPKPKSKSCARNHSRIRLGLERLEDRDVPTVTPLSNELLAGTGSSSRTDNDVAMSGAGRTILVWRDGVLNGLYGRLLDENGTTVNVNGGANFLIEADVTIATKNNPLVTNSLPRVSMDGNGEFVVVWQANVGGNNNIRGKVYNLSGQLIGNRFDVVATASHEITPAVSMDTSGNFVVAWIVDTDVKAQRYATLNGQVTATNPVGNAFFVSQDLFPYQYYIITSTEPQVAMDNGKMAFSWTDAYGDVLPNCPIAVMARSMSFVDLSGSSEFFVDALYPYPWQGSNFPLEQFHTSVAITNDGLDYVVSYHIVSLAVDPQSTDPTQQNVWAKLFEINPVTTATTVATAAFMVNTFVANSQINADVAMDDIGNFVVTWVSRPETSVPAQDGSGDGVFARAFGYNATTHALTPQAEFQVNQTTLNNQFHPTIALSNRIEGVAKMTIAWMFDDPSFIFDIFYRRYSVTF